jgi:hypothetical protein
VDFELLWKLYDTSNSEKYLKLDVNPVEELENMRSTGQLVVVILAEIFHKPFEITANHERCMVIIKRGLTLKP